MDKEFWKSVSIKVCEAEVTNAYLVREQECPINVVSFGKILCNSILSLQFWNCLVLCPEIEVWVKVNGLE